MLPPNRTEIDKTALAIFYSCFDRFQVWRPLEHILGKCDSSRYIHMAQITHSLVNVLRLAWLKYKWASPSQREFLRKTIPFYTLRETINFSTFLLLLERLISHFYALISAPNWCNQPFWRHNWSQVPVLIMARLSAPWQVAYRAQALQFQPLVLDFSQASCHGTISLAGFTGVRDPVLSQRPKMPRF